MFEGLKRKARMNRAIEYLRQHPEDEPAVKIILASVDLLNSGSARTCAEISAQRRFTDDEWRDFGPRWERAWYYIIR
nr:hypothetical protein [Brucella intermedia]